MQTLRLTGRARAAIVCSAFLLSMSNLPPTHAQWPTHLGNTGRTASVSQDLKGSVRNYKAIWRHTSLHAPRPSWPAPARSSQWQRLSKLAPRVIFDQAFHPVISNGLVIWGSSSDDSIRAVDARTGSLRWTYYAAGPVRLAPHLTDELCVFGSDDGYVHVVRLADGGLVRKKHVAPSRRLISGNSRVISTWPVRSGVAVDDGVVYCTAGLFPGQGAWALAFDAQTGEDIWRTEFKSISPQGYLLLSADRLFVPTGRTAPVALDRKTGRVLNGQGGAGGTYAVLVGETLLSGPGNTGELRSDAPRGTERLVYFKGSRMAVTAARSFLLSADAIECVDRPRMNALTAEKAALKTRIAGMAKKLKSKENSQTDAATWRSEMAGFGTRLDAIGDELPKCTLWKAAIEGALSIAAIGEHIVVGRIGGVSVLRAIDGQEVFHANLKGRVLGLAATDDGFIASTDTGEIVAFGTGKEATLSEKQPIVVVGRNETARKLAQAVRPTVRPDALRGFALFVGGDPELAVAFSTDTQMNTVLTVSDAAAADLLRRRFSRGLGAHRLSVMTHTLDLDSIARGLFNLVVVQDGIDRKTARVASLMVAPDGGILASSRKDAPTGFKKASVIGDLFLHRRGALKGAGAWTHAYADAGNSACSEDRLTSGPLSLKWFGGPGPSRMVDRHLRTAPPLAAEGVLLVGGTDRVIAVDAHNGIELWQREISGLTRTGFPYDGGYMAIFEGRLFAAAGAVCWELDLFSGRALRRHALPNSGQGGLEWGNVMVLGDSLIGTAQPVGTSRRGVAREDVVAQYKSGNRLVTAARCFSRSTSDGTLQWSHATPGLIASTLTALDGRLYFVQSRAPEAASGGAHSLAALVAGGVDLVALRQRDGRECWRQTLSNMPLEHSIFVAAASGRVVVSGAGNKAGRNHYWFQCHHAGSGKHQYGADHPNNYGRIHGDHGEQVHHPVLVGDLLLLEPLAYNLKSRTSVHPGGGQTAWNVAYRRGCGTFSASADSLFYRNQNPMVTHLKGSAKPTPLTRVTRPGCWINILPAFGLVLLPEGSAGCVCGFSLQTSLAFTGVR